MRSSFKGHTFVNGKAEECHIPKKRRRSAYLLSYRLWTRRWNCHYCYAHPHRWGHYAMTTVVRPSVRPSVCLSVPCLTLSRERKGIESWKLAGDKPITIYRSEGQSSRSLGRLMLRRKMCRIFGTGRPTNFKLGIRMKHDHPRHQHAQWPQRSKVKVTRRINDCVALQVITCWGQGHICGYLPHSSFVTRYWYLYW